jgi:WD40 repeat protein
MVNSIKQVQLKPLKLQRCYELAFSKSGNLLLTLARDVVGWNVLERSKRFRSHLLSHPASCAVHPDESKFVVKNTSGKIVVLDAQDGGLLQILDDAKDNEGSNIVYSACGDFVVDGSWNGTLTVRSSTTGKACFQQAFPNEMITRIARVDTTNEWFVVHKPKIGKGDKPAAPAYVSIWNWPLTEPKALIQVADDEINGITISPDASRICLICYGSIITVDTESKKTIAVAPCVYGGTQFAAAWSPDSQEIATVQRHSFVFYSSKTLERRRTVDMQYASDVAYTPDGRHMALGSWECGLLVERMFDPKSSH